MIVLPIHVKIMPHAMMVIIITRVFAWLIIVELIVREVIKVAVYIVELLMAITFTAYICI